jgi:cytochrome P450
MVFMSTPEDVQAILSAPAEVLHSGRGGSVLSPIIGRRPLMLLDEDEHLTKRRSMMPSFRRGAVEGYKQMIFEVVRQELAVWPLERPFAAYPRLRSLTLTVILRTIFGDHSPLLERLHACLLKMLDVTASLTLQEPWLSRVPPWRSIWRAFLCDRASVDHLVNIAIQQNSDSDDGILANLQKVRNPDGNKLTPQQVRDEVVSLIVAGHETTASQLAWGLQLLAHHPGIQRRLHADITEGGDSYLVATLQEIQRHRSPLLFLPPRVLNQPIQIAGYTLRPPAQLIACTHLMHHDPSLFTRPETFRPERFLERSVDATSWAPWGGGRRRCPGHRLATLEMKTVLRTISSSVTIEPAAAKIEQARWRSVIVTPSRGCRIVLRSRDRGTAG